MPGGSPPPELHLARISKAFGSGEQRVEALHEVSFQVGAGRFVSLLGPSGCGKTTLLEIVAGLGHADSGSVLLDDQPVTGPGRAGYMPQKDLLLPWRTLLQNVMLGPEVQGESLLQTEAEARELLGRFGLAGFEKSYPAELSGGMKQRAALLRTVMYERRFLILDEPLSALDALTRLELQGWLGELVGELGSTTLLVTHDIREALRLSDTIIVLSGRPGTVVSVVELPEPRPRDARALGTPEIAEVERELMDALLVPV